MSATNLIEISPNLNQAKLFTLNDGTVRWKSSKQETTMDSTTELEYIDASYGSLGSGLDKVVHLRNRSGP